MNEAIHTPTAEDIEPQLRAALETSGHRFTAQRAAVFETLVGTGTHPTADEIFTAVRQRIPDISLATVYKALEAFVSCGLAQKLTLGSGSARYDGRTDNHDHVRCAACGCVADVEAGKDLDWLQALQQTTDFELVGYRLELVGYCPSCQH